MARNGALLTEGCSSTRARNQQYGHPIGNLGWPCPTGASIGIWSHTGLFVPLNCVIFYSPTEQPGRYPRADSVYWYDTNTVLDAFREYLEMIFTPELVPRLFTTDASEVINLTDLAVKFYRAMPRRRLNNRRRRPPFLFKTVVFVPVYGETLVMVDAEGHLTLSSHIGLYSEGGLIFAEHRMVPMPLDIDLNEEPQSHGVALYCICALPYRPA